MSDEHERGIAREERVCDAPFGRFVERGRGLLEDQDRRAFEQRAGDRDALPFAP